MKPKLLLLEDEPASRHFLCLAAEALPAEVEPAATVAEARALALSGAHALWLFDVNLPDGSGGGLLAWLRAQGLQTPAIAHTAAHETAERARLLAEGFLAVVTKPLTTAAWQAAIRDALKGPVAEATSGDPRQDTGGAEPADTAAVWDDTAAAAALGGSATNVAALRQLFLAELPDARDTVVAAAADGDLAAVRAALHKLRASCGFVGAARLQAAVAALQGDPAGDTALQRFLSAVAKTLEAAAAADDGGGG
ncbi:response regulator [Luteimonas suaedae]|uniref:response regulator n=1 Tax=Luteimonas suaedae TaxID=2605430 RepID=UPI00272E35E8|nr:response regulator [Luteimonas suaedae]